MPLTLTIACSSKSRLYVYLPGFTFLVPAHPGSSEQEPEGRKMVIVVVLSLFIVNFCMFFVILGQFACDRISFSDLVIYIV